MSHVAVIGAGITGITSAYILNSLGYQVTVLDQHLYAAMGTSYANGGQLSACNAEVWNTQATVKKGLKWMSKKDAPLLLNPSFSLQKYSWLFEFLRHIPAYETNTVETVRLALLAREKMFEIAETEGFEFDLVKKGILHIFHNETDFHHAHLVNQLLNRAQLERYAVTPEEMRQIEPALTGSYAGGFYTPGDATGDIHKFCRGLSQVCAQKGVKFLYGVEVVDFVHPPQGIELIYQASAENMHAEPQDRIHLQTDAIVVCGGVSSYAISRMLGDHIQVYPVKGYSITVQLNDTESQQQAPWVSLLDESAKIVSSRLGLMRLRVAGTAEFNGYNRDIRADRIQPLINWVNQNFQLSTAQVVPWAGLRPMMPNMMPVVSRGKRRGVYYHTGHGHLGWTLSAATAVMLGALIEQDLPV